MPIAELDEVDLYYEIHGIQGEFLVLISGLGGTKLTWPPTMINNLIKKFRVIIFDNRGAGKSSSPEGPYTMASFAKDIQDLLSSLGISKANFLGISMGGMILQQFLVSYPHLVNKAILGCTHPASRKSVLPSREVVGVLMKPRSDNPEQDYWDSLQIVLTPEFIEKSRELLYQKFVELSSYPIQSPKSWYWQYEAIKNHTLYGELGKINGPVLIQTGDQDVLIPADNSKILKQLIPNAEYIEYPNTAHLYFIEAETKVTQDVIEFLLK